jgi:hypothetical protein
VRNSNFALYQELVNEGKTIFVDKMENKVTVRLETMTVQVHRCKQHEIVTLLGAKLRWCDNLLGCEGVLLLW